MSMVVLNRVVAAPAAGDFSAVDARTIPATSSGRALRSVVPANALRGMELAFARADGWATMGTALRGAGPEAWWSGVADAAKRK